MLYKLIRPLLFLLPSEIAHRTTLKLLKIYPERFCLKPAKREVRIMGLTFPNPFGIAAGIDKDGEYIDALAKLGFGFIEVGTVTPLPQAGNPLPRLFRLPQHQALINRMGLVNKGVDHLIERLKQTRYPGILGINIGKNPATPLEEAYQDYLTCYKKVYSFASYVVINISSPNTPGLRQLQWGDLFDHLLAALKSLQKELHQETKRYVPLVIKLSPDEENQHLQLMAHTLLKYEIDGIIATNTTVSRQGVEHHKFSAEKGGLSGKPLNEKSSEVIKQLHGYLQGKIPIIASGGILTLEDVNLKFEAGASLVQLFTGLVYQGPGVVRKWKSNTFPTPASESRN